MSREQHRRLTIIGLGLIGGSLGMALRASAHGHWQIIGHDRERAIERRALALGAIDRAEPDLAQSVRGSDVVIIATPDFCHSASYEGNRTLHFKELHSYRHRQHKRGSDHYGW